MRAQINTKAAAASAFATSIGATAVLMAPRLCAVAKWCARATKRRTTLEEREDRPGHSWWWVRNPDGWVSTDIIMNAQPMGKWPGYGRRWINANAHLSKQSWGYGSFCSGTRLDFYWYRLLRQYVWDSDTLNRLCGQVWLCEDMNWLN